MADIATPVHSKTCTACKTPKPVTEFSKNASNADGLQRHCKACIRMMAARSTPRGAVAADVGAPAELPTDQIVPSLTNRHIDEAEPEMLELVSSVRRLGVLEPIIVRVLPANRLDETARRDAGRPRPGWEIVAGERRWRAARLAELKTIPAMVRVLDDTEVLEIQIVENLQRKGLSELEEAEAYHRLVEQAHVPKEEIGERVDRSRSYVYQRLKLLDLNPAGREALRKGKLDFSKALIVARIPNDKLQIKALGQATGEERYGSPMSKVELQQWVQTNVMLSLKRTKFDIKDETLNDGAGACMSCPKRTGAQPDVFADVDSPDLCIDTTCYRAKEKDHDDRRFDEAQREGKKVIEAAKAEKMAKDDTHSSRWLAGYYDLDQWPDYRLDVDGNTLRRALGKHCPEPVLVKHPKTGAVHEVLTVDAVKRLIEQHGLTRSAKRQAKQDAEAAEAKKVNARKTIDQRPEYQNRWQRQVLAAADAKLKTLEAVPAELLRAFLLDKLSSAHEGPFGPALELGDEFDENQAVERLRMAAEAEMPTIFLRWMLWDAENGYDAWDKDAQAQQGPRTPLFELIHMAGVDLTTVQADVHREMESEDRAADMEAAEAKKAVKAAAKASRTTAPPAAPAASARGKARAGKTRESEARAGIAEALRAADGSHNQAPSGAGLEGAAAPAASLGQAAAAAVEEEGAALAAPDAAHPTLKLTQAWPLLTTAPTAPVPVYQIGGLAQVKKDSKVHSKSRGRVGRVAGLANDGRVQLRFGPRSHELLMVATAELEPYSCALSLMPGHRVRVLHTGVLRDESFLWRSGEVAGLASDGWRIKFPADGKAEACEATFLPEQLEVLA